MGRRRKFHNIEYIYYKYRGSMYQTAYTMLNSKELSEDAVHMAFERIIKSECNIDYRNEQKTQSFLITVCRNVCIDILRKDKKESDFQTALEDENGSSTEEIVINKENLSRLLECINSLKPIWRDVMMLKFYQGYEYGEIAQLLGITEATARKRVERGRCELKKMLEKEAMKDEI